MNIGAVNRRQFLKLSALTACAAGFHIVGANAAEAGDSTPPLAAPKVDLRPAFEQFGLAVRHQGKRGACQVFAMVGVIEYQLAKQGKPAELSEQYLMWAANDANNIHRQDGFNPDLLFKGLKKHGICRESLMPYVPENLPIEAAPDAAVSEARSRIQCTLTSIKHWSSPIGFTDEHLTQILRHLDKGEPVTVTLCWPYGLYDEQIVSPRHFIIDKSIDGKNKSGHGVIFVGYGYDSRLPGSGYFIIRNSWGTKFADKGYAKVTFDFARKYGTDAYIVNVEGD